MSEQDFAAFFERVRAGFGALARHIPKVLEDPRAYQREAMLIAIIAVLALIMLVLAFFALLDAARDWGRRKELKLSVKRRGGWQRGAIAAGVLVAAVLVLAMAPLVPFVGEACGACHAVRVPVDAWEGGAHEGVSCYACHATRGAGGAVSATASGIVRVVFGRTTAAPAGVGSRACLHCHGEVGSGVTDGGVRMRHSDVIAAGMVCSECHVRTGHEDAEEALAIERRVMSVCLTCHDGVAAFADCDGCHASGGPLDVGDSPRNPGTTPIEFTCRGCHSAELTARCTACHGVEMPHPAPFLRQHAGASHKNPGVCARCHEQASPAESCACHTDINQHGTFSAWFPQHGTMALATGRAGCNCHKLAFCALCHDSDPYRTGR